MSKFTQLKRLAKKDMLRKIGIDLLAGAIGFALTGVWWKAGTCVIGSHVAQELGEVILDKALNGKIDLNHFDAIEFGTWLYGKTFKGKPNTKRLLEIIKNHPNKNEAVKAINELLKAVKLQMDAITGNISTATGKGIEIVKREYEFLLKEVPETMKLLNLKEIKKQGG